MENLKYSDAQKAFLNEVNNTPYYWGELPLEDLPAMPNHNRKIVVSGFNCPDLEENSDERIYITIKRIFTDKSTGEVLSSKKSYNWEITANLKSIVNDFGKVIKEITDDEGNVIETKEVDFKVQSVKLMRFLLLNKQKHLKDLFAEALTDFATQFKEKLDTL